MSIFREYDIRGVVGTDLTTSIAKDIGYAFGAQLKKKSAKTIAVGQDARLSSPDLFHALSDGICSAGIDVLSLGICPTPLLYFSLFQFPVDGGIMITGSHNPAEYNGFKLCLGRDSVYGERIQALRREIENIRLHPIPSKKGVVRHQEVIPPYLQYISKHFSGLSGQGMKVVLDSGNATAGLVAPGIFRDLGCDVIELYSEPDGNFPNHHPDPTVPENLEDLIKTVQTERAAFGVGYDGDADRIGVVDENGSILWGDQLMMLFARDIIDQWKRDSETNDFKKTSPPLFISEVKATQLLYDDIQKRGGRVLMWRTGHSLMKSKMKEEGAALAGEMSGHMFFGDRYFGYDDAVYASIRLLELILRQGKPLSMLLADLPKTYSTPEIRVDASDDRKFVIVERMKEELQKIQKSQKTLDLIIKDLIIIDGIRVVFEGGWGLLRASNTQPAIVQRFEADSPEGLSKIQNFMEALFEKVKKQT